MATESPPGQQVPLAAAAARAGAHRHQARRRGLDRHRQAARRAARAWRRADARRARRDRRDAATSSGSRCRADGARIRANQGHSVQVELGLPPADAAGGALSRHRSTRRCPAIRAQGLIKGQRHHVHLSADIETAKKVGGRRGKPVVLAIKAAEMVAAGHTFLRLGERRVARRSRAARVHRARRHRRAHDLVPHGGGTVSRAQKVADREGVARGVRGRLLHERQGRARRARGCDRRGEGRHRARTSSASIALERADEARRDRRSR